MEWRSIKVCQLPTSHHLFTSLWSGHIPLTKVLRSPSSYSPVEDHHRITSAALRPPADWKRRSDVQEQPGSEQSMKMSSPRTSKFTLPGGRPKIKTFGTKSSARQRSDRSSPIRNKKSELRLTRRAKAYSSSCSQTVSLSPAVFTKDWRTTVK